MELKKKVRRAWDLGPPGGRAEPVGVRGALPELTFALGGASWALL